jgi:hypothetical protein
MESNHFGASDTALYFLSTAAGPVLFYYLFFFLLSTKELKKKIPLLPVGISAFASFAIRVPITLSFPSSPFFLLDVEKTRRMESTAGIYV